MAIATLNDESPSIHTASVHLSATRARPFYRPNRAHHRLVAARSHRHEDNTVAFGLADVDSHKPMPCPPNILKWNDLRNIIIAIDTRLRMVAYSQLSMEVVYDTY